MHSFLLFSYARSVVVCRWLGPALVLLVACEPPAAPSAPSVSGNSAELDDGVSPPADAESAVTNDAGPAPSWCLADEDCAGAIDSLPACAVDRCDPITRQCTQGAAIPGTPCDDGDACTSDDACFGGTCVPGPTIFCNDGNPCTTDSCDPVQGCLAIDNQLACDDGDACTVDEHCSEGQCTGGTPLYCDDQNSCTEDTCLPASGCRATPLPGAVCDDEDACTTSDTCSPSGVCTGLEPTPCDDDNPCTTNSCSPLEGCLFTPKGGSCSDDNPCTHQDSCVGGLCVGSPNPCDDGDPCTLDSCDVSDGCEHLPHQGDCDDGKPCTIEDTCASGLCIGVQDPCDDDNDCTVDFCHPVTGCASSVLNAASCDDGNPCTQFDYCDDLGFCLPGTPTPCDDGNECTSTLCDEVLGCVYTSLDIACDDLDTCTQHDQCKDGTCTGVALDCDDENPCTNDSCVPALGCRHQTNTLNCDDGDACTYDDICDNQVCVGTPETCDDGNDCTFDSCQLGGDCQHLIVEGGCEDGDPCTLEDTCEVGECIPGFLDTCDDEDPCTFDACEPDVGCTHSLKPICQPPTAWLVINEFDYEQTGDDTDDFVELLVVGDQTIELDAYRLELIDGSTGQIYEAFDLSTATDQLHPGEMLVIAPAHLLIPIQGSAATMTAAGDFLRNGGTNGDAIRVVRQIEDVVLVSDAVSYEAPVPQANEGESHVGFDGEFSGESVSFSRCPEGQDSDDNALDFWKVSPSPGLANTCSEISDD